MSENDVEMKQPAGGTQEKKEKKRFFEKRSSWTLMVILISLMILFVAVLIGAWQGINDRVELAEAQALPKIQSQIESAALDLEEGRYQIALNRLDWILDEMTTYLTEDELSEVGALYSRALLMVSLTSAESPVLTPSPTTPVNTPTPDLRGEEELFASAQEYLAAEDWDLAVQTLEALRNKNIGYKTIQVDGMMYLALRNRGVEKILIGGGLEPGIYDLTLAERFAPLDSTALGFRTWARLYLTGASFWEIDWSQVVYFFEQVYPALPNLRDGTGMTATERFRIGAIQYALELAEAEEYCLAQEYLDKAMALASDPEVQPTQQWIAEECWDEQNPPTKEPTRAESTQAPPTQPPPTQPQPTQVEPTPTPTLEETVIPTEESPTEEPPEGDTP